MPHVPIPSGLTGFALKQFIEAARGDELDRLFAALATELGGATGFSAAGLIPIREDPEVLRLILDFLDNDVLDGQALADAIEPHVYQLDENTPPSDVARIVVEAIKRLAWRARKTDREAVVHEVRRLHEQQSAFASPRYLSLEWVPRPVQSHIQRLSMEHPDEARHLEDALAGQSDQRRAVETLVKRPQSWLSDGSADVWTVVGHLAAAHASWECAQTAFVFGADKPGADQAALLAKAAEVANARGDTTRAAELLDEARSVEPGHPEIVLAEARLTEDPRAQLERLDDADPRTPGQVAATEAHKALAHLALGEIEEAEACGERARAAAPDSPFVREVGPVTVLVRNVQRGPAEAPDWKGLIEAAAEFLDLRDELRELARFSEASRMAARAGEALVLAGEVGRAGDILETLTDDELAASDEEARLHLAETAVRVRPDLVARFLGPDASSERAQLLRAWAKTETGPDDALGRGVADLENLLQSRDEPIRVQAAIARLGASARIAQIPWSDEAEAVLAAVDDEGLAPILKAEHFIAAGNARQAEDLLLDNQDHPQALELLAELAEKEEDWVKALPLLEALLDRAPSAARRLRYAETLLKAGRSQDALAVLAALRSDAAVPTALRSHAYALSAQQAWNADDFATVASLAGEWLALSGSPSAAWAQVQALLKVSDYERARAIVDEHKLTAADPQDAHLLAYLFHRALPPAEALARIAELSDQFDRADEQLEALVIMSGLGATDDIPEELRERRRVAFEEFQSRFPNSQIIRAFPAPETPEEIDAFFREHFSKGSQQQVDAAEQVARGEAAVAVLAAIAHREVATVWGRLERLPLGYGDPTLDDLERADAAAAIGGPAVWDSSALVVAGGLGDPATRTIVTSLPGAIVPLAVLQDADQASQQTVRDAEEQMFAGWDPVAERPTVTVLDADWIARDRSRAEGVLSLARRLRDVPDTNAAEPTKYDEVINQTTEQPALRAWAATYAVATRSGFPLYSDDRYIRAQARRDGIATFGTIGLLEALVERGRLDPGDYDVIRRRLRASGAIGIAPTEAELLAEAESAGWELTASLRQALLDPTGWRDASSGVRRHVNLLRAAFDNEPTKLEPWVARVLDAARLAHPGTLLDNHATVLLASAWASEDARFVQALVVAMRAARSSLGAFRDPVAPAFDLLLSFGTGQPPAFQAAVFWQVIAKLDSVEQMRMLEWVALKTKQ